MKEEAACMPQGTAIASAPLDNDGSAGSTGEDCCIYGGGGGGSGGSDGGGLGAYQVAVCCCLGSLGSRVGHCCGSGKCGRRWRRGDGCWWWR